MEGGRDPAGAAGAGGYGGISLGGRQDPAPGRIARRGAGQDHPSHRRARGWISEYQHSPVRDEAGSARTPDQVGSRARKRDPQPGGFGLEGAAHPGHRRHGLGQNDPALGALPWHPKRSARREDRRPGGNLARSSARGHARSAARAGGIKHPAVLPGVCGG